MRLIKKLPLALIFAPLVASAGSISGMSPERAVKNSAGEAYVESDVSCAGRKDTPTIWRKEDSREWCGKDVPGFCARSKISAAQKVCSSKYNRLLSEQGASGVAPAAAPTTEAAPPASQSAAPAVEEAPPAVEEAVAAPAETVQGSTDEQLAIEKERLAIEQKRLELRKQQIELQKQELEIKKQMEEAAGKPAPAPEKAAAPAPKVAEPQTVAPAPAPAPSSKPKPAGSVLGM